ncbi:hypothetical protein UlMin_036620 [Ulmus minor]
MENKGSSSEIISSAIEELSKASKVRSPSVLVVKVEARDDVPHPHIPTKPFLSLVNNLVLQVLDKIGPTMAVLRQDVNQNIQRLEMVYESDPSVYSNLVEILKKEVKEGNARKSASCCRALVWLTRSLDFTTALLQKLITREPGKSMEQIVEESYNIALKPWHRWISSAAFKVALKLVPDNEAFISLLLVKDGNYESLKEEMQSLILLLLPFLEDVHSVLRFYNLDRLKAN